MKLKTKYEFELNLNREKWKTENKKEENLPALGPKPFPAQPRTKPRQPIPFLQPAIYNITHLAQPPAHSPSRHIARAHASLVYADRWARPVGDSGTRPLLPSGAASTASSPS
jgi:hypothetical protein